MPNGAFHVFKRRAKKSENTRIQEFLDEIIATEKCFYCETELVEQNTNLPNSRSLDHIIPKCRGGKYTINNFVCSCRDCNGKRSHTDFIEFGIASILAREFNKPVKYFTEIQSNII